MTGYLVEYGGLTNCDPILYAFGTVTIDVPSPAPRTAILTTPPTAGQALLLASPNPSTGLFRVQVLAGSEGVAHLDLFDGQGRRVRSLFTGTLPAGELRDIAVEAQGLNAGLYLLRLQSGSQVQQLRMLIQK
jgi:hypothetical protein